MSRQAQPHALVSGPPYLPRVAILGGIPNRSIDIPICSVFIGLFAIGAVINMIVFRRNKARGHKFLPSFLLYVFCMARIVSCTMRIVWACYPKDARIAIAAVIFVSAGVLILFLVNLIFAQRILRAGQPQLGWNPILSRVFILLHALIVLLLAATVTVIVQSYYTMNPNTERIDRNVQLGAMTYFLTFAFLPIFIVYISFSLPRKSKPEHFGIGRLRTKQTGLLIAALLATLGAAFRTGTEHMAPRPMENPAWYHSRSCFYLFNFTLEIMVIYLYIFLRVDLRFHVPNGSKAPGDYSQRKLRVKPDIKREDSRRNTFSSYARIISAASSVYSFDSSDRTEHSDDDELSNMSSASTLALPAVARTSGVKLEPLQDSPYIDLQFITQEETAAWWPSLPSPATLKR